MAIATLTTMAEAIKEYFEPGFRKTFYDDTPLMRFFGTKPRIGDTGARWKLAYSTGGATLFNEGDGAPAPGNVEYADMYVADFAVSRTVTITGHARAAARNGYFDAVGNELAQAVRDVQHKAEETVSTRLCSAIDDDATYAGQTRTTVHADAKVVAGGSGALTLAMLSEMYETLQLEPRGVIYDPRDHVIISAPEQLTAYTEKVGIIVTGDAEASGVNLPYNFAASDTGFDAGLMGKVHFYNRIPWLTFATLANTNIRLTRRSDVVIEEARPITIDPLGKTDDTDSFLVIWQGNVTHRDPYRSGNIEALTT
jgi:hypothetical protein